MQECSDGDDDDDDEVEDKWMFGFGGMNVADIYEPIIKKTLEDSLFKRSKDVKV